MAKVITGQDNIKYAFADYMAGFYASLAPATPALAEFAARGLSRSVILCPGRMIDAVQEMLAEYRKNDNSGQTGQSSSLPVILCAFARDYTPAAGDFSPQIPDDVFITLPNDDKERIFKMRLMQGDRRVQVAFIAADEPTVRLMAAQFCLWIKSLKNRYLQAVYPFAGQDLPFPIMLETPDTIAAQVDLEQKNTVCVSVDITLKESVPIFTHPLQSEPNDGLGTNDTDDPSGFISTQEIVMPLSGSTIAPPPT